MLYPDEIHGDLFTQAEKTIDLLLTKYLNAGVSYRGIQRVESLPVPEPALREAVLNALVHKDYSSGTPNQISVYADKLMLWNPGELLGDWTVEELKDKHPSRPFNPDLANAFFRAGMIEAWGRGIERILEACRSAKVPDPELRYDPSGFWIEFSFPDSTTQEKIIALLRKTPTATRRAMAEMLGISESGIKYHLDKLKSNRLESYSETRPLPKPRQKSRLVPTMPPPLLPNGDATAH